MGGNEAGPESTRVGTWDSFACAALSSGKDLLLFLPSSSFSLSPIGHYHLRQETFPDCNPWISPTAESHLSVSPCLWWLYAEGASGIGVPSEQDSISFLPSTPSLSHTQDWHTGLCPGVQAWRQGLVETRSRYELSPLKGDIHVKVVQGSWTRKPEISGHEFVRARWCPDQLQGCQGTRQGQIRECRGGLSAGFLA